MFIKWLLLGLCFQGLGAVEFSKLKDLVASAQDDPYDLQVRLLKGRTEDEKVLILLHGMGGDNRIGDVLQTYGTIPDHLLSFNFPDANLQEFNAERSSFGTIREIMPVFYLLKKLVLDGGIRSINLYGFSAGGGALVNTIAVLNGNEYDNELKAIGIDAKGKQLIMEALQKGVVLLDAPLKSMQEIIDTRGYDEALGVMARRYQKNGFEPIEALKKWQGVRLRVIVYFEKPDELLSNRDDALFVERLKKVSPQAKVLEGNYGGHISYHTVLWKNYLEN